jgi:hypothetical protein
VLQWPGIRDEQDDSDNQRHHSKDWWQRNRFRLLLCDFDRADIQDFFMSHVAETLVPESQDAKHDKNDGKSPHQLAGLTPAFDFLLGF